VYAGRGRASAAVVIMVVEEEHIHLLHAQSKIEPRFLIFS
jgi:hypothetical protein